MRTRKLGNGGLEISAIGLGFGYGPAADRRVTRANRHLLAVGPEAVDRSSGDLRAIEDGLSGIAIWGNRHPAHLQKLVGR